MREAITITVTGTWVERIGRGVVVLQVVEVAMADVEAGLGLAKADQNPPAPGSKGVHQQVMDQGARLLFQWSIYATLNLVDDPAMLAIIFT
jgi:hypothetical protein